MKSMMVGRRSGFLFGALCNFSGENLLLNFEGVMNISLCRQELISTMVKDYGVGDLGKTVVVAGWVGGWVVM